MQNNVKLGKKYRHKEKNMGYFIRELVDWGVIFCQVSPAMTARFEILRLRFVMVMIVTDCLMACRLETISDHRMYVPFPARCRQRLL